MINEPIMVIDLMLRGNSFHYTILTIIMAILACVKQCFIVFCISLTINDWGCVLFLLIPEHLTHWLAQNWHLTHGS